MDCVFAVFAFSRFRFFPFPCLAFSRFRVFVFRRRHPRGRDTDFVCTDQGCLKGPQAVMFFNRFFCVDLKGQDYLPQSQVHSMGPVYFTYMKTTPKKLPRFVGFHMPFAPLSIWENCKWSINGLFHLLIHGMNIRAITAITHVHPFTNNLLLSSRDIQAIFVVFYPAFSIEIIITCRGADGRGLRAVSQQPLLHRHLGGTKEVRHTKKRW